MLLAKQYETIQGHYQYGVIAVLSIQWYHCHLWRHCRLIFIVASCHLRHHRRLVNAASLPSLLRHHRRLNYYDTAHHRAVAASVPTQLYCSSLGSCGFHANLIILLVIEQLRLPCRLLLYGSSLSSCGFHAAFIAASSPTSLWHHANFIEAFIADFVVYWRRSHSPTPVGACCLQSSIRPYKVTFNTASYSRRVNIATSLPLVASSQSYLYSGAIATCGVIAVLSMRRHCHLIIVVASLPLAEWLPSYLYSGVMATCGVIAILYL